MYDLGQILFRRFLNNSVQVLKLAALKLFMGIFFGCRNAVTKATIENKFLLGRDIAYRNTL